MQQRHSIFLKQIIGSQLLAIPSETPLKEVIQIMSHWTNSCLLTVKNRLNVSDLLSPVCHSCVIASSNFQVEGIFTELALVCLIASQRKIEGLTLAEVMSRNVVTINASGSQDIFTALNLLRRYQIDYLPIVDEGGKLLSLVTYDSLQQILRSADLLKGRTVKEVMSRAIHAFATASILEVARLMSDYQVNSIPIVELEAGNLLPLGIITARDIVQFQSIELNLNEVRVGEVMSMSLFLAHPEDSLWKVCQQMNQNRLRRLVVVGERGELLGIITQRDLLRAVDTQQLQCSLIVQNSVKQLEQTKIEALERRNAQLCDRLEQQAKREQLVAQTALRIGQSLDLDSILRATVTEVRQLIESDRVLIYHFESDGAGIVSTEAVSHPQWSIINCVVKDACFKGAKIAPYQQGHIFKAADIEQANLSPCHLEFLKSFQVKAIIVIPILLTEANRIEDRLWGLLIVHQCSTTRSWQASELELLQLLTSQVAIAIQQGELYQQVQSELEQRRRAETAVREREAQLRTALDAAAMGTWVWNITTNRVSLSERSQSILGFNAGDSCTLDAIRERIHPQDLPQIDERVEQAIASGGLCEIETRIILVDGKQRWLTARGHVVQESAAQLRMIGVLADITEKKQLEEQSSRHQRLENLGSLAGGVAHDLNNIFTPIMMSVQLLPVTLAQIDPRSQELIQMLENNVKRGSALVQQVLSFARGIEGKRGIVQVKHLIEDIRQIAMETFPKSIQIRSDVVSNLWAIQGDATKIHQVLLNLAINARDAMPDGGILNLSAANLSVDLEYVRNRPQAKVGAYIVISVADTGIGIPSSNLEQIFEPFFTTKATKGGTGLGLATVINIVREHDGFIDVVSEKGEGTQFNVFIPATEVAEAESSESLVIPKGRGELILVADDEATIREITKASLETHDYRVVTANNGIEAVAAYVREQSEIAVVLMNMLMPDMDGATAIRTLQTINPDIKILAVSGRNFSRKSFRDRNLKIKGFLAKPYTTQALLQKISKLVSRTN